MVDHAAWSESMRAAIDERMALLRDADPVEDPRMRAVFDDTVQALAWVEGRLAWLRYVADTPSSAFDSGDAGMLARAEARPLAPALRVV
jgi:hypothetical protein